MAKSRNTTKKTTRKRPTQRKTSRAANRKNETSKGTKSSNTRKTTTRTSASGTKRKTTTRSKPSPKISPPKSAPPAKPHKRQSAKPIQRQPTTPSERPELKPDPSPPHQTEEFVNIKLDQSVAILIDGNNIEMSLHAVSKKTSSMINFDKLIPVLLNNRALSRLIYFREGKSISQKLAERLQKMFHGSVVPCHKSADIPLSIKAVQVASKVDTIIILSGDADYVELVRHLKHDGIRVEIAAFPETTADILRQESDYFFPITVDYSFVLK